jgi:FMN phosphatase YigB (HAD superfamily)
VAVGAVFFDVGETLVDETAAWEAVADAAGVPRLTLLGLVGGTAALREDHRRAFELLGVEAPPWPGYGPDDFYPDALPCLRALKDAGYVVGLAGNQPQAVEPFLAGCGVEVDVIASSASWRVSKPDPRFFELVVAEAGLSAGDVAYVGDRLDNDVLPAAAAGLVAVFLRRGPWGFLHAEWPEVERAHLRLESLAELPEALAGV